MPRTPKEVREERQKTHQWQIDMTIQHIDKELDRGVCWFPSISPMIFDDIVEVYEKAGWTVECPGKNGQFSLLLIDPEE